MNIKVEFRGAGISNASVENWQRTHFKYNRIHMPLEGRAIYHDPKGDRVLHEGMAYLLVNSYSPNFEMFHDYRYYHMYIDFRTIPPLIDHETVEIDLSEDSFFLYLLKAVQTMIQENIRLYQREKIMSKQDDDQSQQIKRLLQVMLTHLKNKYNVNALENPKIESAIRYIDEHYTENIRNEDIASALYIDKRTLIRLFSKYMDMSPCQYLTQRRIEYGIEELRRGKSVTETAYLCGYQSETAFRAAFKRVMGCLPKAILE